MDSTIISLPHNIFSNFRLINRPKQETFALPNRNDYKVVCEPRDWLIQKIIGFKDSSFDTFFAKENYESGVTNIVFEGNEKKFFDKMQETMCFLNISNEASIYANAVFCLLNNDKKEQEEAMEITKKYMGEIRNSNPDLYEITFNELAAFNNFSINYMLLSFLSNFEYNDIFSYEETFAMKAIKKQDELALQEEALNTILSWGAVSDVSQLSNLMIKNAYLEKDLKNFLKQNAHTI